MKTELQAFLDVGALFEGKVTFTGTVQVNGHFRGEASAEGVLIVGEEGFVEADLTVGSLVVNGRVRGDVTAKHRVEVGPKGEIVGRVRTPRLQVHDGATLDATLEMGEVVPSQVAARG